MDFRNDSISMDFLFRIFPERRNRARVVSKQQYWFSHRRNLTAGSVLLGLSLALLLGCQGNNNSSTAPFDLSQRPRLFGSDSIFTSQKNSKSDRYALDLPDLRLDESMRKSYDELNQRMGAFDSDNQLLNTEIAGLQHKLDLINQYNQQLKDQLAGTSNQMSQIFAERESAQQTIASLRIQLEQSQRNLQVAQQQLQSTGNPTQLVSNAGQAATQLPNQTTIRSNNSLLDKLSAVQIQGAQARLDGDVIRIEFPSDRTFVPGTYQIQPAQLPLLQNVAAAIQQNFPRQIIGIEAHWDNSPLGDAGISDHQLTATQSLAIFNELIRLGLNRNQVFTMAMASNRPRHSNGAANGISPNRRIEIVIYPETFN
jgi:flagellar motor protein MotB